MQDKLTDGLLEGGFPRDLEKIVEPLLYALHTNDKACLEALFTEGDRLIGEIERQFVLAHKQVHAESLRLGALYILDAMAQRAHDRSDRNREIRDRTEYAKTHGLDEYWVRFGEPIPNMCN